MFAVNGESWNMRLNFTQISTIILLSDIAPFAIIFLIIFLAFAVGLWLLYHQYSGYEMTISGTVIQQQVAFDQLHISCNTLFWGLFGYSVPDNADVILPAVQVTNQIYLPEQEQAHKTKI